MSNLTRGTVCLSGRQAADWTSQSSWVQEEIRNVEGRDLLWLFYTVIIQRVIIWERGGAGREGKSFHFQKILTAPGDSTSKAGFVSENWHFSKALCANDVPSMLATLCQLAHGTLKWQLYEEIQLSLFLGHQAGHSGLKSVATTLCYTLSSGTRPSDKSTDRQRAVPQSVGWLFEDNFKLFMTSGNID